MTAYKHQKRKLILLLGIGLFLFVPSIYSFKNILKKSKDMETKSLYMQSKYPRIELPKDISLSEKMEYKHAETLLPEDEKKQDSIIQGSIDSGMHIKEVEVKAKFKFTPEHNGKVDVDFIIKIPKELLSPKWRIILFPKLLHNDSIVNLDKVILKGSDFYQMQKDSYASYDAYMKSIVQKKDYDSAFLDRKGINKDIQKTQGKFYKKYQSDWSQQKNYLDQLSEWKRMQDFFYKQEKDEIASAYTSCMRKISNEKYDCLRHGKDSTGIYNKYMKKFQQEKQDISDHWLSRRNQTAKLKPREGKKGVSLSQIRGRAFSSKDSVDIAKTRYDFRSITQNEIKEEQKDKAFNTIVRFPYEKSDTSILQIRIDSIISPSNDFIFVYKQTYKLTPNLKRIRIYMDSRFDATDFSSYDPPIVDTLTYNITTLAQLADTSLIYNTYKVVKNIDLNAEGYIKYAQKGKLFDVNYRDNRKQIKEYDAAFNYIIKNKYFKVDSVNIVYFAKSWAFGDWEKNYYLSQNQCKAFKDYLVEKYRDSISADTKYITAAGGENWKMLASAIKASDKVVNKEEILHALTTATFPDKTKAEIKKKFSKDYAFICDSIYPSIEKTRITISAHRTDMKDSVGNETRRDYMGDDYAKGVRLLLNRDYENALPLLAKEGGYNTALCMTCMGYNAQAYKVLTDVKEEKRTANDEYLLALICCRLENKEDEAVEHLMRSFKLDDNKKLRAKLDYEIYNLVQKRNIDLK